MASSWVRGQRGQSTQYCPALAALLYLWDLILRLITPMLLHILAAVVVVVQQGISHRVGFKEVVAAAAEQEEALVVQEVVLMLEALVEQ